MNDKRSVVVSLLSSVCDDLSRLITDSQGDKTHGKFAIIR